MDRPVLERDHELGVLAEATREAAAGQGCVVLVSGEAGIGKSRLVAAARTILPAGGRVLVGHCDDLATARVLGPFRDLAGSVGADLAGALCTGADRDQILTALRSELAWNGQPTLLAIEDVHWADDATLDVLHYLVRRLADLPVVLLLTYRDDDLPADHPVRRLLGLASAGRRTRHLPLQRLTLDSVRRLSAGRSVDPDEVFAVTAGNPFFVTEVLASGAATGVPRTVVDAVLARVRHLGPAVRSAVEQLAVLPTTIDRWLVEQVVDGGLARLAAAEEHGLLVVLPTTPTTLTFRHELTRRAIADALPAVRRLELNRRVLAALVEQDAADVARIVHHAAEAGDHAAIVRYGPDAARDAAGKGAHREAAAYLRLVLDHAEAFPPVERAALLEGYAVECYTLGDYEQAVRTQERALELRRALGDGVASGAGLRWLSRMQWSLGDRRAAERSAREAVAVLEPLGGSRSLALAYSNQANLDGLDNRPKDAEPVARRAVELARKHGDPATLSYALGILGGCLWGPAPDSDGEQLLWESLQVALDAGETDPACRAYVGLACNFLDWFRLDDAERVIAAGIELAESTEHVGETNALRILGSKVELGRGTWDRTAGLAEVAATSEPMHRCVALVVLGRIAARRGDGDAAGLLASAITLSRETGELQRMAWASGAAAESAWLRGDHAAVVELAGPTFEEAYRRGATTLWPELGYWLTKAGHRVATDGPGTPYELLAAGRWREAADFWEAAGYRYEHAMALSDSDDPDTLLTALEKLDLLDARPLARITRQRLRDLGIAQIPRGPAAATRDNPAGLTSRQFEVLRLLSDGLTNAQIADRLVISVRTAGNHVAAVLDKLGVNSRADAADRARRFIDS